jgi:hypothetical protein
MRVDGAYPSNKIFTIYSNSKFLATFQEKIDAYQAIMGTNFAKVTGWTTCGQKIYTFHKNFASPK